MNTQKTLVTGATGLIGAALTRQLARDGAAMRIFRRPTSRLDLLGATAAQVEHATGDLADPLSLRTAMEGVRRVYHVAGALPDRHDGAVLRRVNAQGTAHVVNAALDAGIERLVYTSSIATLDAPSQTDHAPIAETAAWQTGRRHSAYAISKRAGELEVQRGAAEGLDVVIVHPAFTFGVGRAGEGTRRLVDLARGGWLPGVPAGGTCVVDAEDAADGHRRAMRLGTPGARYLLGGENCSWRSIFQTLAEAFGARPPTRTLPPAVLRGAAWLAETGAFLTRRPPLLNRPVARRLSRSAQYDNRRAVEELGCTFRPFPATARRLAKALAD